MKKILVALLVAAILLALVYGYIALGEALEFPNCWDALTKPTTQVA